MDTITTAVRHVAAIGRGATRPHLFLCDDGCGYVVKTFDNPQGPRMIPNEWIAYRLGMLLELPIPPARLVTIPQELPETDPGLAELPSMRGGGPHFGSRYDKNTVVEPSPTQLAACVNLGQAADMIAFDNWIKNWDRAWRRGKNILITRGRVSSFALIDHGGAFTGTHWNPVTLMLDNRKRSVYWGENYAQFVKYIDSSDPFREPLRRIESLSREAIRGAVLDMPPEWGLSDDYLEALAAYLIARQPMLRGMLTTLSPLFPVWRASLKRNKRD